MSLCKLCTSIIHCNTRGHKADANPLLFVTPLSQTSSRSNCGGRPARTAAKLSFMAVITFFPFLLGRHSTPKCCARTLAMHGLKNNEVIFKKGGRWCVYVCILQKISLVQFVSARSHFRSVTKTFPLFPSAPLCYRCYCCCCWGGTTGVHKQGVCHNHFWHNNCEQLKKSCCQ